MTKVLYRPKLPLLYQVTPILGNKIKHGFAWTTQYGSHAASRRLTGQMLENEKIIGYVYPYIGTIKFLEELSAKDIKIARSKIVRAMTKLKINAHQNIEVTRNNKVDLHITFRDCPAELMKNNGEKLKAEVRKVVAATINMQFQVTKNSRHWINYSLKSKICGYLRKRTRADPRLRVTVVRIVRTML